MAWWMAAVAVAGAVAGNDAEQKSARAADKAFKAAQRDKIKAANSVLYASYINRSLDELEGRKVASSQLTAFASSGVDITSGSAISTLAATEAQMIRNDFLSKYKAEADYDLIMANANAIGHESNLAAKNSQARQTQNLIGAGISVAKESS